MAKRSKLPTSNQTSLVDTFTCAIAILFVLILSLAGSSTQPISVVVPNFTLVCLVDKNAQPSFHFADNADMHLDTDQIRDRLKMMPLAQSISARLAVKHLPEDTLCRDVSQKLIDAHNHEVAAKPLRSTITENPYLILDLVPAFELRKESR